MTDLTRASRVLLNALDGVNEGRYVHADTLREPFDAAQLTSA